jgi:hypothetical protein
MVGRTLRINLHNLNKDNKSRNGAISLFIGMAAYSAPVSRIIRQSCSPGDETRIGLKPAAWSAPIVLAKKTHDKGDVTATMMTSLCLRELSRSVVGFIFYTAVLSGKC